MDPVIPAVFESGVFRPLEPVELEEGAQVLVHVPNSAEATSAGSSPEELAQEAAAMSWPDFVERTYGSCGGLGLQRHEQGSVEVREPIA